LRNSLPGRNFTNKTNSGPKGGNLGFRETFVINSGFGSGIPVRQPPDGNSAALWTEEFKNSLLPFMYF
jgi:hypothetical protein